MEHKATGKSAGMAEKGNENANGGKSRQYYKKNINLTTETGKEANFRVEKRN